jgi:hypothetical protein
LSAKQDRQGARTVSQFKQELNFGERFADVMGIATGARTAAEKAQNAAEEAKNSANNPSANLTPEEVFNLLTENGAIQGFFRGTDGQIYFNASYVKSGIITVSNGKLSINLESGEITVLNSDIGSYTKISDGAITMFDDDDSPRISIEMYGFASAILFYGRNGAIRDMLFSDLNSLSLVLNGVSHKLSWKDNGDGTYSLIGK